MQATSASYSKVVCHLRSEGAGGGCSSYKVNRMRARFQRCKHQIVSIAYLFFIGARWDGACSTSDLGEEVIRRERNAEGGIICPRPIALYVLNRYSIDLSLKCGYRLYEAIELLVQLVHSEGSRGTHGAPGDPEIVVYEIHYWKEQRLASRYSA